MGEAHKSSPQNEEKQPGGEGESDAAAGQRTQTGGTPEPRRGERAATDAKS